MSKIAKRAKVSPATIYVYFENKEDLLRKLYLNGKQKMSDNIFRGIDSETPVRVGFELVLRNAVDFILNNKDDFLFLEQFSNSPLVQNLCLPDAMWMFQPIFDLFERGKREQLLKQVDTMLLITYAYFPVVELVKQQIRGEIELNSEMLTSVIQMSWDAVKA